jgi:glutaminase
MSFDYNSIFEEIFLQTEQMQDRGKVADYIPELGEVDGNKFGAHLITIDNRHFSFGDSHEKFSIQSIAKVLTLSMAYKLDNEKLWKRVGVEPSGTPFNSLVQLEYDEGIPRNPFINAGALVVSDVLISLLEKPKQEFIDFVRKLSNNNELDYCARIAQSEKESGYRNAALVNLMKSFGNIDNDVEEVLDFYFNLCSIRMTCKDLAQTFMFLTNNGIEPVSGERILSASKAKRINAVMQTCGFYDEAGEFSFKVGLPGKSGVGGGIVALLPNHYCITTWSPKLNKKGNSYKGMKFLELFTTKTELSIF